MLMRRAAIPFGLMALTLFPFVARADDKVRILVRTFIPSNYPASQGELLPLPGSLSKMLLLDFGKVPFLAQLLTTVGQPTKHCFAIDNRTFSDKPDVSARVTGDFLLAASATPQVETPPGQRFRSGVTRKYDCRTGAELAAKNADVSACVLGNPAYGDGTVQLVMDCRASDPLVPLIPAKWVPDVHFSGTFTYSLTNKTLAFKGDVAAFPSFEAYASLNGGAFKPLFKVSPAKNADGQTLVDLWQHINFKKLDVSPVKL